MEGVNTNDFVIYKIVVIVISSLPMYVRYFDQCRSNPAIAAKLLPLVIKMSLLPYDIRKEWKCMQDDVFAAFPKKKTRAEVPFFFNDYVPNSYVPRKRNVRIMSCIGADRM
eukprot:scaffold2_cov132-Skeletonema_menzelii.AAC.2